jgi:pyruvate,water dikinase
MIPFCRTVEEGRRVVEVMKKNRLVQGENGLEIYMMVEIPSNVVMIEEFGKVFDGFSIGSNDLTQLTLGLDRDSAQVSHIFDERDRAVMGLVRDAITKARKMKKKIGICGQAPSDYPEFARFLVETGINSISLNSDTVIKTTVDILKTEKSLQRAKAPAKKTARKVLKKAAQKRVKKAAKKPLKKVFRKKAGAATKKAAKKTARKAFRKPAKKK